MKNVNFFRFKFKIIAILLLVFLTLTCKTTPSSTADYSGLGKGTDKVPLTSRALTGTLPNGLRYYILENTFPENRAHLALIVNAGSVVERDDERGLAHFVEHLAFNGTARFPEYDLIEYLRSLGMRFGADANAYTSYDETVYHFDVPVEVTAGVKRIPDRALAILDDWTYAVSFNPADVADESLVVLEELRTRLGAMDRVRKIVLPILFKGSAYENREVIGLSNILENATSQQLKGFYDRWYTSDNMALVFVGDFDGKALEKELARHFNMNAAAKPVNRPVYDLPPPVNGNFHIEIITDPELTESSFDIYYKQKQGPKRGTIENYRKSVIDHLISHMLSMRFNEASTNPASAVNYSWGGVWNWSNNSGFYNIGTSPKTGSAEEALFELLLEKESIRRYGFTESELYRAKISLVSSIEKMVSEKDKKDSREYISAFTGNFLYGEGVPDIEWEAYAVNALLPGIGTGDIAKACADYFAANDINLIVLAPQAEAASLPSEQRIRAIFRETENTKITPRADVSFSSDLLDRTPNPGTVVSQQVDAGTGSNIITLSNGATIILKETTNRNNEIIMNAMAKGGTANAAADSVVSAKLLPAMINFSGLGPYSLTELVNKMTGKQVSFNFSVDNYNRGLQGTSTTQDITTLFEMIHLFFTNPRLDENAIAAMIDQYRSALIHQSDDPQNVFFIELEKLVNNNHPLFMPLELADMDKVSVRQASSFLNQCLNPADYTFIFTGNFDVDKMRDAAAAYIGSIPSSASMNNWINPNKTRPAEGRRTIYKGMDERGMVYITWLSQAPSSFNEQQNQVSAVLTEYLNILLNDEIRENLGGVYSIQSQASISVIPSGQYELLAFFICNPQRVDELVNAVTRSIAGVSGNQLNMNIFNQAKEALLMSHDRSMQQNSHIAQSYANSFVLFGTPLNRLNQRPDNIRAVTAADVQALCAAMTSSGSVQLVLYPEGWK
ncbi:MAG: insulinase family protein [Treponema sp.]|jgi:zinc protease|nr:insulinase family protein [Treponema sp.]